MVGRSTWYCKCGWKGQDMSRVAKHQGIGEGHYQVELVEWAQNEMQRIEQVKARGIREQTKQN